MRHTRIQKIQRLQASLLRLKDRWVIVFLVLVIVLPVIFAIQNPTEANRLFKLKTLGIDLHYQEGEFNKDSVE